MSQLAEVVRRRFARLENTRFGGDAVAGLLGLVFFSFTVGIEKLDPRNVGWLTYGDQQQHLLGWFFYTSDRWRWPLGANPNWGWEGTNSIVYTDSWPGLAVIFKFLDIDAVNHGQYFGFGFLIGAIALFVGARRLFHSVGLLLLPSLVASGLLVTTSVFWWMQRWYPALSAGLPILVWAVHFYIDDSKFPYRSRRRWSILLVLAVATHAYLLIAAVAILGAVYTRRLLHARQPCLRSLIDLAVIGAVTTGSMFVLGYFTLPSKWAQTGGYGWYSANALGLIDSNDASRVLPDIPSLSGQYEPTALGLGVLLLLVLLIIHRLRSRTPIGMNSLIRAHPTLVVVLIGLSLLAISNTVSIAVWSYQVPLPERLEHGLSTFRSSARFMWPTVIVASVAVTVFVIRRLRHGLAAVALVLIVQIADSSHEMMTISRRGNSERLNVVYDDGFWSSIPKRYTTIASLPAESLGLDWASCALVAVNTDRKAECGYFSRVQDLESVNRQRTSQVLTGALESGVIYLLTPSWMDSNAEQLLKALSERAIKAIAAVGVDGFSSNTIILFPDCNSQEGCQFLGDQFRLLRPSLFELGIRSDSYQKRSTVAMP